MYNTGYALPRTGTSGSMDVGAMTATELWFADGCDPDNGGDGPSRTADPVRSMHGLRYGFPCIDGPRHSDGTVRM